MHTDMMVIDQLQLNQVDKVFCVTCDVIGVFVIQTFLTACDSKWHDLVPLIE